MTSSDVFTIETSHGPARLTRPRPSDVGSVPSSSDRRRDHRGNGTFAPGNQAASGRGAKRAIVGSLKDARKRVQDALRRAAEPETVDVLMSSALALYEASRRELASASPLVLGPLATFATQSVLADHYLSAASKAGLTTKRGAALLGLAHACEARSERAETMALAAVKALADRQAKRPQNNPILAAIEAAGRPTPANGEGGPP